MQKIYLVVAALLLTVGTAMAQGVLKGTVYENGTNKRMSDVFIRDENNKQVTITDKNGAFSIRTTTGHTLIFNSPGYVSDTLYLIDMIPKRILLNTQTIALREVNIS